MNKRIHTWALKALAFGGILLGGFGCGDADYYAPKPIGYFRIDFPEKAYTKYDSTCPFTFEYPQYARVLPDKSRLAEPCWLNIDFPSMKGRIHLSYKQVNNNIDKYLQDAYELTAKHQIKASSIDEMTIKNDSAKVYGMIYSVQGNAASSMQFFVTDSNMHFLRGALYFSVSPNGDSIASTVDFIKKDISHVINTLRWK